MMIPKFRAWDKVTNIYRKVLGIKFYPDDTIENIKVGGFQRRGAITPDKLVLEQFTGLKDANGKEIYEGDIVVIIYQYWGQLGNRYEVKFKKGAFCVEYELLSGISKSISVIGNVHTDHELLEE